MTLRNAVKTHGDVALAGGIGLLFVVEISLESRFPGHRLVSYPPALLFAAALAVRRRAPVLALAAAAVVIEFSNFEVQALAETGAFLFGIVIAIYSAGRWARGRQAMACVALILAAIPAALIEPGSGTTFSDVAFFVTFFTGPWIVGRIIRYRSERERDLTLERDTAVGEERARIARELHDVVAHAISVMVLQARGGRRMLDSDPAETRDALDTIERAGQQALAEMRRLLGMLRQGDEQLALAPQPSLARIDDLVAALTATGLPVDVEVQGEPIDLPPGVDVSAYRIVQEALTNALKHAGPARARVTLRYSANALELEITDDGAGSGNGGGSGHGLAGIRERVAVYGGELESGHRPEGGYALRARLPLGSER